MLIGEDPFRTDYLWQMMYRGYFYPAGREKITRWERWMSRFGI
jgi:L-alanine-DL-glutamate epimerase-like enolase superfamily enzyme